MIDPAVNRNDKPHFQVTPLAQQEFYRQSYNVGGAPNQGPLKKSKSKKEKSGKSPLFSKQTPLGRPDNNRVQLNPEWKNEQKYMQEIMPGTYSEALSREAGLL